MPRPRATAYDAALAYLELAETAILGAQRALRGAQGERGAILEAQRKVYAATIRREKDRIIWERAFLECLDRAREKAQRAGNKVAA